MRTDCLYRDNEAFATPRPSAGVFDSPAIPLCLNTEWASHLDGLLETLLCPSHWEGTETEVEAAIQQVQILMSVLADIQECPTVSDPHYIGEVYMAATANTPPKSLPCDGGTYLREDYPDLYAALDVGLKSDADHFQTPALNNGKTPIGVGSVLLSSAVGANPTNVNVGMVIGAAYTVLTSDQMPVHHHNRRPSGTAEGVRNYAAGGGNSAFASGSAVFTSETVTGDAGGGGSHSNYQPSTGMKFFIFAGV